MAWIYMAVLNTGLQMLACMLLGWACACFRLVDAEQLSRQLNDFAVKVSIPAFILHLLGIKSDLRNAEAWRALGVYLLWALLLQAACLVYMQLRRGSSKRWQRLGSNVLLLTANNTGLVGTPVVTAALGPEVSSLGLLIGMLVTLEMLPVAVTCFEWQRWQQHPPEVLVALSRAASRSFHRRRTSTCSSYRPSTCNDPATAAAEAAAAGAASTTPRCAASVVAEYMGQGDVALPVLWAPSLPSPLTPAPSTLLSTQFSSALEGSPSGGRSGRFASAEGTSCRTSGEGPEAGGSGNRDAARAPVRQRSSMLQELQRKLQLWSSPSGQLQQPEPATAEAGANLRAPSAAVFSSSRQQAPSAIDLVRGSYVMATAGLSEGRTGKPCNPGEQAVCCGEGLGAPSFEFSCSPDTGAGDAAATSNKSSTDQPASCSSTVGSHHLESESTGHGTSSLLGTGDNSNGSIGAEVAPSEACSRAREHLSVSSAAAEDPSTGTPVAAAAAVSAALPAVAVAVQRSAAELRHVSSFREWHRAPESPFAAQLSPPAALVVRESAAIDAAEAPVSTQAPAHGTKTGQQQQQPQQQQLQQVLPQLQGQQHRSKVYSKSDGGVSCSQRGPGASPGDTGVIEALVTVEIVSLGTSKTPLHKADCSGQQIAACTSPSHKQGFQAAPVPEGEDHTAVSGAQGGAPKQAGQLGQPWAASESRTPSTMGSAGCFMTFLMVHPQLRQLVTLQAKNHLLWFNLAALLISLSGLRRWLDPASPEALPGLGWVEGTLRWGSATCVPTMLFANGVWMYGKPIISKRTGAEVGMYILLRMLLLPGTMALICVLFGLRDVRGMALVVLACAPVAQLAFVLTQQYDAGAEVVTGVIILGIVVMLPHIIGVLQLAKATGLFSFELQATAS